MAEVRLNPEEFPDNSHTRKEGEKASRPAVKAIVKGSVTVKKPLGRKIAEAFTGDDSKTVGEYIVFEVFIPAAKSMISDAVSEGIHRMLFGTSASASRRSSGSSYSYGSNRTSYRNRYNDVPFDNSPRERRMTDRGRATHDFSDLVFDNRGDAEEVLDALRTLVNSQYGEATVADFYELCELEANWVDRDHGWRDLREAAVKPVRGAGYILDLPLPQKLS